MTGPPSLSLVVTQEVNDGIGFTVGYICCTPCSNNCLQVQCPPDKTVQCGTDWMFDTPTATTCCTNLIDGSGIPSSLLITPTGFVTNGARPQLTITESWMITDGCGHTTNCSQTVTVLGCCSTNCLVVQCPTTAKTVPCGTAWTFDPPTATSCCTSNVSGTLTNVVVTTTSTVTNSGPCPQVITRTWLITDACGNSNTCSQTVKVVDTTPPVITCPTGIVTVALNSNCELVIPGISVTATDNCTPVCSLVYTQSPPAGTIVSGNSAVVTVTVTDLCGNSNQCQVQVEGLAETRPVMTCPATVTATNCYVPCVPVTATDNCCKPTELAITQSPPCGTLIGPGINSITVTVTDCHGNTTTKVVGLSIDGPGSFLGNLYNTGASTPSSNSSPVLLADGVRDPFYALPASALSGLCASMPADYLGYPVAVSDTCHAYINTCPFQNFPCYAYVPWALPPDPAHAAAASKWIAPNYTNNGCCPAGVYAYTMQFTLPSSFSPATATISGRWAADNFATMELNGAGVLNNVQAVINVWNPFTITSGFVTGTNTLTFFVTNILNNVQAYCPNFTGLRVEFTHASACSACAPPVIHSITPGQSLQAGSTATFTVNAGGTPPSTYQWYLNGVPLAGATNATLQVHSITVGDAGLYSVVISNPCGAVTGYVRLNVTPALPWPNGSWNVQVLTNPLAATFGPDLVLAGTNSSPNLAISAGTTEDFGLPDPAARSSMSWTSTRRLGLPSKYRSSLRPATPPTTATRSLWTSMSRTPHSALPARFTKVLPVA